MIKLKIGDKEFKLASDWDEVTFAQYINLVNVFTKDVSSIEKSVRYIASVSDNEEECVKYLYKLSKDKFEGLQESFKWLDNSDIDFLKKCEAAEYIVVKSKRYKIVKEYNKLSLADMVNIETILENHPNLSKFEVAFGVLIKEIDVDGKELDFTEEQFIRTLQALKDEVLLKDVYGLLAFFLSGETEHIKDSVDFSVEIMK